MLEYQGRRDTEATPVAREGMAAFLQTKLAG
jgi:hypothetical protein